MRIQWFQHVPFEGLGTIESWARANRHPLHRTRLFAGEQPLTPLDYEMLIVMGGPMGTRDVEAFPWLGTEKGALEAAIDSGKLVLGICLGAQLIAEALGGRVFPNLEKEIGWFPVTFTAKAAAAFPDLPAAAEAFHWHGDTFDLPVGGVHFASSEACASQAFLHERRILALQFHLEVTPGSAAALARECPEDLRPGTFVQDREVMLGTAERFTAANRLMVSILDRFSAGEDGQREGGPRKAPPTPPAS